MTKFDEEEQALIQEFELQALSEAEQAQELVVYFDTLHTRIGMALEDALTEEQLAEMAKLDEADDEAAMEALLKRAVPNYQELVDRETAALKQEIKKTIADIHAGIDAAQNSDGS